MRARPPHGGWNKTGDLACETIAKCGDVTTNLLLTNVKTTKGCLRSYVVTENCNITSPFLYDKSSFFRFTPTSCFGLPLLPQTGNLVIIILVLFLISPFYPVSVFHPLTFITSFHPSTERVHPHRIFSVSWSIFGTTATLIIIFFTYLYILSRLRKMSVSITFIQFACLLSESCQISDPIKATHCTFECLWVKWAKIDYTKFELATSTIRSWANKHNAFIIMLFHSDYMKHFFLIFNLAYLHLRV